MTITMGPHAVALTLLLSSVVCYIYYIVRHKRLLQYKDFPQVPPSLIWGHLAVIGDFTKRGDARRHVDYVFRQIAESLGMPPIMVLDMRPFFWVMCIVLNNDVAEQLTRGSRDFPYSLPKSPTMGVLQPITGVHSIIAAQGEYWKSLRKRYNAGFAPSHLMSLLPRILEKTPNFLRRLDALAQSGEEFSMEPLCTNLTFDIIGAVVMDVDLKAQLPEAEQSELVKLYRQLVETYTNETGSGFVVFAPLNYLRRIRTARAVDATLKAVIREKFDAAKAAATTKCASSISEIKNETSTIVAQPRSVLALSLQDTEVLNPTILQETSDQLKSFLFAGHDTTSIVLQWAFYELSLSPQSLAAVRAEHDDLFGPDPAPGNVSKIFCQSGDEVVRKMKYTSAVIKETLRLHPPAGTARRVPPGSGFFVKLPDGTEKCLDGMVAYNMASAIHRDPAIYGDNANAFTPERWLGDVSTAAEDASHASDSEGSSGGTGIPASAWRPFERGPRNCIGQELANLEARVILALVVRRYDFGKVGAGKVREDEKGLPVLDKKTGRYQVETELFSTRRVTSKPFDAMMMKVRMR